MEDLVTLSVKQSITNVERYTCVIFNRFIKENIIKSYTIISKVISPNDIKQIKSFVDEDKCLHINKPVDPPNNHCMLVKISL